MMHLFRWGVLCGAFVGGLPGAIIGAAYVWWEGLLLGYIWGGLTGVLGLIGRQRIPHGRGRWVAVLYGSLLWSVALLLLDGFGHSEPHLSRAAMIGLLSGGIWGGVWDGLLQVKERMAN